MLLSSYYPFVYKIASFLKNNLPPCLEFDDLVQAGMIGLIEASNRYVESDNNKFESFAYLRIKGEIIDTIRAAHPLSKHSFVIYKNLKKTQDELENLLNRKASNCEIAEALNIDIKELDKILLRINNYSEFRYDSLDNEELQRFLEDNLNNESHEHINITSDLTVLLECAKLNIAEYLLLELYYTKDLRFSEASKILQCSQLSLSIQHSKIIEKIKTNCVNIIEEIK
jgi:RNA polymerase sigma factor for flagellar operon FliA